MGLLPNEHLMKDFVALEAKTTVHGVRFYAPSHERLDIDFPENNTTSGLAPGYTIKRKEFDNYLIQSLKSYPNISVLEGQRLITVTDNGDFLSLITDKGILTAGMVVGADGAQSIIVKQLSDIKVEKNHYCAGLRVYYEGVEGFHEGQHIELHFYKEVLPGYFWLFPLPNGQANVGIGMLSKSISQRNIDLKALLSDILQNHPQVALRFSKATPLESVKGFGLPIGSKKRNISGHRFLLTGDATSLIDPFTGEGIGNTLRSGRVAAEHIQACFREQRFDAAFNKAYDKEIYRRMWKELRLSRNLQLLLRYPRLFDSVVKRANRSHSLRMMLASAMVDIDIKKELVRPSFYMKLFTQ